MQVSTLKVTVSYKQTTTLPASHYTFQSAPLSNRTVNHYSTHSPKFKSHNSWTIRVFFRLRSVRGRALQLTSEHRLHRMMPYMYHVWQESTGLSTTTLAGLTSDHEDHCRHTATSSPAAYCHVHPLLVLHAPAKRGRGFWRVTDNQFSVSDAPSSIKTRKHSWNGFKRFSTEY